MWTINDIPLTRRVSRQNVPLSAQERQDLLAQWNASLLDKTRKRKIRDFRQEAIQRLAALLPNAEKIDLELLADMHRAGMISAQLAADLHDFVLAKETEINGLSVAELQQIDTPNAPGWPT